MDYLAETGQQMHPDAIYGVNRSQPDVHLYYSWLTNPTSGVKYGHYQFLVLNKTNRSQDESSYVMLPLRAAEFVSPQLTDKAVAIQKLFPGATVSDSQFQSAPGMTPEQRKQLSSKTSDAHVTFTHVSATSCPSVLGAKADLSFTKAPGMSRHDHERLRDMQKDVDSKIIFNAGVSLDDMHRFVKHKDAGDNLMAEPRTHPNHGCDAAISATAANSHDKSITNVAACVHDQAATVAEPVAKITTLEVEHGSDAVDDVQKDADVVYERGAASIASQAQQTGMEEPMEPDGSTTTVPHMVPDQVATIAEPAAMIATRDVEHGSDAVCDVQKDIDVEYERDAASIESHAVQTGMEELVEPDGSTAKVRDMVHDQIPTVAEPVAVITTSEVENGSDGLDGVQHASIASQAEQTGMEEPAFHSSVVDTHNSQEHHVSCVQNRRKSVDKPDASLSMQTASNAKTSLRSIVTSIGLPDAPDSVDVPKPRFVKSASDLSACHPDTQGTDGSDELALPESDGTLLHVLPLHENELDYMLQ